MLGLVSLYSRSETIMYKIKDELIADMHPETKDAVNWIASFGPSVDITLQVLLIDLQTSPDYSGVATQ